MRDLTYLSEEKSMLPETQEKKEAALPKAKEGTKDRKKKVTSGRLNKKGLRAGQGRTI